MSNDDKKDTGKHPEFPLFFDKKQASKIIGISTYTISKMVENGVLKKSDLGIKKFYFTWEQIQDCKKRINSKDKEEV